MIATATHDTKRGEDARARLIALSEMPDAWARALDGLAQRLCGAAPADDGEAAPDANDRYMLLQTILGAWPMELLDGDEPTRPSRPSASASRASPRKALREAKRHTSWVNVNEAYEDAALGLVARPA